MDDDMKFQKDIDLRIDPGIIKEREYQNRADTDQYQVDILTKESQRLLRKAGIMEEGKKEALVGQLFLEPDQQTDEDFTLLQMQELNIFTSAEEMKNTRVVQKKSEVPTGAVIGLFVALGVLGFILGKAANAHRRRNEHVSNSNSTVDGEAVFPEN